MRRFQKDKRYIRQDYRVSKQTEQVKVFDAFEFKVRVSTPKIKAKVYTKSMPRLVQQSLLMTSELLDKDKDKQQEGNIYFKEVVSRLKQHNVKANSFYRQFLELQKESRHYIDYYSKKHNYKYTDLIKIGNKDKNVILIIFRNKFPRLADSHMGERKLLALGINPSDDFDTISWKKYSLLRKLMTHEVVNVMDGIRYLTAFFLPNGQASIKKQDFILMVTNVLRPCDDRLRISSKSSLTESIITRLQGQPIFKSQDISGKELGELIGRQFLFNPSDFLFVLFAD